MAGEVLGILGESGSGKSVTVDGRDVLALRGLELANYRGSVASMIFQDPMLALDPVYTIGDQIAESIIRHEGVSRDTARQRTLTLLELVRIPSPERRMIAYPHEISGGMRQRVMIALALAAHPKLLLADEPTTALDATVQIQILLLLRQLQRDLGMGVIFVTHDIGVAVEICDRLAIMYAGQIIETGTVRDLIRDARHPYTRGLLAANLHGARQGERLEAIPGAPPALGEAPTSCPFAPRCRHVAEPCRTAVPPEITVSPGRSVRCILAAPVLA